MNKPSMTVLLVSNQDGRSRRLVIPLIWFKIGSFVGAIILLTAFAGLLDYFGLLAQALENKRLRAENAQLKKQFTVVETKVSSLESSLERVKTFTTKLKLITNMEANDRVTRLSMNPTPEPGQQVEEYEPMDQRASTQELIKQDAMFAEKKPVDEHKGEIVAESAQDYGTLVVRIDKAVKETQLKEQSVIELWEALSERQSLLNATPNVKPARGWLTSKFGYRMAPFSGKMTLHAGLDIAAAPGSPIYAPADGVVTFAGWDESYGKLVSIDHGYGVTTRFGHTSQMYVQVGQKISKWDVIAAVGTTGRSTGPHLHYEVRINGTPVDPANFILDDN